MHIATGLQAETANFAHTMKQRLSLLCTWTATLLLLMSTVVMHHHHYERVCVALQLCQHGTAGDIEAEPEESHSHHETDSGSCRIHQLHKFIVNQGIAKQHQYSNTAAKPAALYAHAMSQCVCCGCTTVDWQHRREPLPLCALSDISRRGPPVF